MAVIDTFESKHGVYRKMKGSVTMEQIMEHTLKLSGDIRADDIRYMIVDWVEGMPTDFNEKK